MKNTYNIFRFLMGIIITLGIVSCSDDREYPEIPDIEGAGTPLAFALAQPTALSTSLTYTLYVFSHDKEDSSSEYILESVEDPIDANSRLKFSNEELNRKTYRFLFTGTPSDDTKYAIVNSSLAPVQPGTAWTDIRLVPQSQPLSIDNYYQVKDMDGQEMLAIDTLYGQLKRIVGQMIFQFIKVGNDMTDIQAVDLSSVTSVFDRIKEIQITYENYTTALAFDAAGEPRPVTSTGSTPQPVTQNIHPALTPFRVAIPQLPLDTLAGGPSAGGKIRGYCFLPGTKNMRTTLQFTYYDTTPICGDTAHIHEVECYVQEMLTLKIPKTASSGLSVRADAYTVNKAGIRADRIIDIGYGKEWGIETEWNK